MTDHSHERSLQDWLCPIDALRCQMSSPYDHSPQLQYYWKLLHCCDCLLVPITMEITMGHMIVTITTSNTEIQSSLLEGRVS